MEHISHMYIQTNSQIHHLLLLLLSNRQGDDGDIV